ncbi:MAG: amidase [Rhizobiales bacterium]|nr:amidase [Hyphomicrobiales bacterium]OJU32784.1 MAG: amidase [Rhizobiales bacterium 68-8]
MSDELEQMDGLGLAELIRDGEVSASEVLEATIARIEARNPALNALVTPMFDAARTAVAAGLPDGPFRGVPYAFKELVVSVKGAPTTSASRLYADTPAAADSELVARARRAGLVVVGKTNSSEFGLQPVTEPHLFGPTRNPWNTAYSPGGSSGGSAAAVASGMLPMAHATDGGGSVRIPASCCGLFGLKPTRGRITAGPEGGEGLAGLACQHAVTWSVRDSAALLDATAGPMPGDPYAAAPPARPWLEDATRDPARLRIAVSTLSPDGKPVDPACAEAAREAAKLCEAMGHIVEEAAPVFDVAAARAAFSAIFQANTMVNVGRANSGRLPAEGMIEPLTRALAERGATVSAPDYIRALQSMHRESRKIAAFFERHDLWLTPTLGQLPPKVGAFDSDLTDVDEWMDRLMGFLPFTWIFNLTGQPAMSVPFAISAEGLPVGVHFAARTGDEASLFALAGQIERARPWRHLRPKH